MIDQIKKGDKLLYKANSADNIPVTITSVSNEVIEFERQDLTPEGTIKVLKSFYSVKENGNDLVLTFNNLK